MNKGEKVSDDRLMECIESTESYHRALIKAKLTPKGANYDRVYRLSQNLFDKDKKSDILGNNKGQVAKLAETHET